MTLHLTPLADPEPGTSSRRLAWLASAADGTPVGSALLRLFTREGREHLAELEISVHGAQRRRGVGSRLLDAAVATARAERRRAVLAQAQRGSAADLFLAARGFRPVLSLTYARLSFADADLDAIRPIAQRPRPGYRLAEWDGTVPDDLARSYADSRRANALG